MHADRAHHHCHSFQTRLRQKHPFSSQAHDRGLHFGGDYLGVRVDLPDLYRYGLGGAGVDDEVQNGVHIRHHGFPGQPLALHFALLESGEFVQTDFSEAFGVGPGLGQETNEVAAPGRRGRVRLPDAAMRVLGRAGAR